MYKTLKYLIEFKGFNNMEMIFWVGVNLFFF